LLITNKTLLFLDIITLPQLSDFIAFNGIVLMIWKRHWNICGLF